MRLRDPFRARVAQTAGGIAVAGLLSGVLGVALVERGAGPGHAGGAVAQATAPAASPTPDAPSPSPSIADTPTPAASATATPVATPTHLATATPSPSSRATPTPNPVAFDFVDVALTASAAAPAGITVGSDGALWFPASSGRSIGRITTAGSVTTFPLPAHGGAGPTTEWAPYGVARGPDGNVWFTQVPDVVGRITPSGQVTEFQVPSVPISTTTGSPSPQPVTVMSDPTPREIVAGPDGAMWFVEGGGQALGRVALDGSISRFTLPGSVTGGNLVAGPDGALWLLHGGAIGRMTTSGAYEEWPFSGYPEGLAVGPDGNLWVGVGYPSAMIRVTPAGAMTVFPVARSGVSITAMVAGHHGSLWFEESSGGSWWIARLGTDGRVQQEYAIPRAGVQSTSMVVGPDGALWVTELLTGTPGRIGRFLPAAGV